MRHPAINVCLPLLFVVVIFPVRASASISAANSYIQVSRDGTRILVMLCPYANPSLDQTPVAALPNGQVANLRATFGKSGVYDARTLAPMWQVTWYEHEWRMRSSNDFQHVVRMNIHARRTGWALAFYDGGKVVKQYQCDELLTGLRDQLFLPFSSGDWHDRWYEDFDLTPDGARVGLSTVRRQFYFAGHAADLGLEEFYTFDLATGAMLERRRTGAWVIWAYGGVGLAMIVAPPLVVRTVWRRIKARLPRRGFEVRVVADGRAIPMARC